MTDPITSDPAMRAAQGALDGLTKKQEVIGQNLANVDTPAYKAQTVDFQTTLTKAMGSKGKLRMVTDHAKHIDTAERDSTSIQISSKKGGTERADGNNVDIDVELTDMTETVLSYQAMVQLVTKKFNLLKLVIK